MHKYIYIYIYIYLLVLSAIERIMTAAHDRKVHHVCTIMRCLFEGIKTSKAKHACVLPWCFQLMHTWDTHVFFFSVHFLTCQQLSRPDSSVPLKVTYCFCCVSWRVCVFICCAGLHKFMYGAASYMDFACMHVCILTQVHSYACARAACTCRVVHIRANVCTNMCMKT